MLAAGVISSVAGLAAAQSQQLQFVNTNYWYIPAQGIAGPYNWEGDPVTSAPSTIKVAGVPGTVTGVTVSLHDLRHDALEDLDIYLVGPHGHGVKLMSDAGGTTGVTGLDLTFMEGASPVPQEIPPASGSYVPTDYEIGDILPPGVPETSYWSTTAGFNDSDPNGPWSLYIYDEQAREGETGAELDGLWGGWNLRILTSESDLMAPPPNDDFADATVLDGLYGTVEACATGVAPTLQQDEPALETGYRVETAYAFPVVNPTPARGSLWFQWTAPKSGRLALSTEGSSYDALRAVYTGSSPDTLTWLAAAGPKNSYEVTEGTTYYFRVDGYGDRYFGTAVLSWDTFGSWQEDDYFTVGSPEWGWHQVLSHYFSPWPVNTRATTLWPLTQGSRSYFRQPHRGWRGDFVYDYHTGTWSGSNYIRRYALAADNAQSTASALSVAESGAARTEDPLTSIQPGQGLVVAAFGGGWQELFFNYTTEELTVTSFSNGIEVVDFTVPVNQWTGAFHYDYTSGRYRELDLRLNYDETQP